MLFWFCFIYVVCMLIVDMSMEYTNAVKVTKILSIFSFLLYGQKVEAHT